MFSLADLAHFQGFQTLQNLHPLVVHYPIALLTTCVPIYFLASVLHRESLEFTGLWLLSLGAVSAAVAVYTGLGASQGVMLAPAVRQHILIHHEQWMLAVLAMSIVLAAWALIARPMPKRGRIWFMVGLLIMVAVLAKGADFGGWMVFGYNAGGSLPQPIDFDQQGMDAGR